MQLPWSSSSYQRLQVTFIPGWSSMKCSGESIQQRLDPLCSRGRCGNHTLAGSLQCTITCWRDICAAAAAAAES